MDWWTTFVRLLASVGYDGTFSTEHEGARVSGVDGIREAVQRLTRALANAHVAQAGEAEQLLQGFQWCARGLTLSIRHDGNCGETDSDTYNLDRSHDLTEDCDGGDRGHERAQVANHR